MAFLAICCSFNVAFGQVSLQGKVTDESNQPISGANIRVSETLAGTTTDAKGNFSLELPNGSYRLRISFLGYEQGIYQANHSEDNIIIKLKEKYVNIDQVVVTGTGSHRRMSNSPVPVKVITAKDLSNVSATSFKDAMQKVAPSFAFMQNGQGTTMNLNGLTDEYIVILENGKRLAGDDTYDRIDIANVKRIEILNGAASALYGSDAIAGVINIITEDDQNNVNVSSNTRYASKNQLTQSVNADIHAGKFGSYTSYQYQRADGWQLNPYIEDDGELLPTNKPASEGFHKHNLSQRFTYDANDRLSFYLRGAIYNHSSERPIPTGENTTNYDLRHETYTYGAGAQYMINKGAYLNADYLSDNHSTYKDYFDGSSAGETDMTKRIHYHDLNVKGIFRIGKYNKLSAGFEYIKELLSSESDNIDGKSMYTTAFYAQDEINVNKHFQAVLGLRYIYHETFNSYATPSVALLYKLGNFNFRASYASGFRTPSLKEIYTVSEKKSSGKTRLTIGNTDLEPEKSDNFTWNAEYSIGRFSIAVSAYLNNVRSMINYRTLSDEERDAYNTANGLDYDEIQMRDNIDKAKVKGVNVTFNTYLGAGFTLNGGYSYTDGRNLTDDEPLDKSIKHSATVSTAWAHSWNNYKLNIDFNGRVNGERFSTTYGYAPRYSLWNLNTTHTFRTGDFVIEPGVGIENLFDYTDDRTYNSNYATLTPGRTYYVSLLVRFKQ